MKKWDDTEKRGNDDSPRAGPKARKILGSVLVITTMFSALYLSAYFLEWFLNSPKVFP